MYKENEILSRCKICYYEFTEPRDNEKNKNAYCPQCGVNLFKFNSKCWGEWARERKLIGGI